MAEWLYGLHPVSAALRHAPGRLAQIWVQLERRDKRLQAVLEQAQAAGVTVLEQPKARLDAQAGHSQHQGVLARYLPPETYSEADLPRLLAAAVGPPLLLVLDQVQDPHNLGACLRSADAAGVVAVVVPKDRAVGLTPAVCKAAAGAAETVPLVMVTNLARSLRELRDLGVWLYGAAAEAKQSLYQLDLRGPAALVLGSEGDGLRRLTREHCDVLYAIPMRGAVSSLNVSVATAVSLFEARRQRG